MPHTSAYKLATALFSITCAAASLTACGFDEEADAALIAGTRHGGRAVIVAAGGNAGAGAAAAQGAGASAGPATPTGANASPPAGTTAGTGTSATTTTGNTTAPLQVSGAPPGFVAVAERYQFAPTVTTSGSPLTFAITSRPSWLAFNTSNGTLSGTPTMADVGSHRGITIQVSNGQRTERLVPFDIEVVAAGTRSATIAWQTPTNNEDGTALTNLAGFRISYGRQPGQYSHSVEVNNPGVASYVVGGLVPGTYYFAMTAHNRLNVGSTLSPEMAIVIR